jgi:predicted nucleotidyltransferase
VYIPIGNYYLGDFIAAKDDYFAVLAYPRPDSIDTTAKYVVYDRTKNRKSLLGGKYEIFANGIGPTFSADTPDFGWRTKSIAFIAHSG